MRKLYFFLFLLTFLAATAQKNRLYDLQKQLANHPQRDTFRVNRLTDIAFIPDWSTYCRDSAANEGLLLSRQLNYREGEAHSLVALAQTKDQAQAIDLIKQALAVAEKSENKNLISDVSTALGYALSGTEQKDLALQYLLKGVTAAKSTNDKSLLAFAQIGLSDFYKPLIPIL